MNVCNFQPAGLFLSKIDKFLLKFIFYEIRSEKQPKSQSATLWYFLIENSVFFFSGLTCDFSCFFDDPSKFSNLLVVTNNFNFELSWWGMATRLNEKEGSCPPQNRAFDRSDRIVHLIIWSNQIKTFWKSPLFFPRGRRHKKKFYLIKRTYFIKTTTKTRNCV